MTKPSYTASLTIKRETPEIFDVETDRPFWSDGAVLKGRVAFDDAGKLSSARAQALDARAGHSYLVISPFCIKKQSVLDAAKSLAVGQSTTLTI